MFWQNKCLIPIVAFLSGFVCGVLFVFVCLFLSNPLQPLWTCVFIKDGISQRKRTIFWKYSLAWWEFNRVFYLYDENVLMYSNSTCQYCMFSEGYKAYCWKVYTNHQLMWNVRNTRQLGSSIGVDCVTKLTWKQPQMCILIVGCGFVLFLFCFALFVCLFVLK